jgi:PAS domain S-box-containing protein
MKINHSYKLFAFTIFLLLIIAGFFVFKALNSQNDVIRSEEHRFRSVMLAIELFQSSEDLTRMARSYVSTGNPIYEKNYFEILDIRNGKQPRPKDYAVTYWHIAGVGRGPAIAPGETVALQDLMRHEGFTEKEFGLLRESQANSDRLVNMEKQAFASLNGLYDDGHGNLTVRRTPDRNFAVRLLFSEEYFNEKARIMAPIQQFMDVLDQRTKDELRIDQSKLQQYILLALGFIFIVMIVVLIKFNHTFRRILFPIGRLRSQVAEIASGNYAARCDDLSDNEIGELCANFNSMANALQTDITERKEVEETLRETRDYLDNLFTYANAPIIVWDPKFSITRFNQAFERITGRSAKDVIGKNIELLFPMGTKDQSLEYIRKTVSGEKWQTVEISIKHVDGTISTLLWNSTNIYDVDGKTLISTIAQGHDITIRKQAAEALQKSSEMVQLLLNSTAEAIYGLDMNGNCTFNNAACLKILGYERSEQLLGKDMHEMIHSKYVDGSPYNVHDCPIFNAFRSEEEVYVNNEVLWRRDGTSFPAEYWSYPVRQDGKIIGAVVTFLDITDRKQAEQALQRATEEREKLIKELQSALDNIKTLQGLIPICANCKKIRDDKGFWNQVEGYIMDHTDAKFTHGLCPDCGKKLYGDPYEKVVEKQNKKNM